MISKRLLIQAVLLGIVWAAQGQELSKIKGFFHYTVGGNHYTSTDDRLHNSNLQLTYNVELKWRGNAIPFATIGVGTRQYVAFNKPGIKNIMLVNPLGFGLRSKFESIHFVQGFTAIPLFTQRMFNVDDRSNAYGIVIERPKFFFNVWFGLYFQVNNNLFFGAHFIYQPYTWRTNDYYYSNFLNVGLIHDVIWKKKL
ncbi:MAG: hypothetical protein ACK4EX_11350 [Thermaurantimonas sp.]|uniref:hypothetical protein n=1 Tax=Thermaurantimonas sp. TaxID=2681568 RepID=UPI00391A5312